MNFVSFPSIEGFHNAVKLTRSYPHLASSPVNYKGKIKLHGCFSKHTLVTLADGSQCSISQLKVGDNVLSYDFEKNEYITQEITETYNTEEKNTDPDPSEKEWIELHFDDNTKIKCTEDHLFYTKNRGWIEAKDLNENDEFVTY